MGSHKTKKKISTHKILDTTSYLLVLLASISFMLSNTISLPTPVGIVTSRSMEPLMTIGDLVFLQPAAIEDIKVGDLIAYHSPPDKTVIHRVVEIKKYFEKIYLTTKGDANPVTDQSVGFPLVTTKNLIGRVYCLDGIPVKIPFIGTFMIDARNFVVWLTQNKIWAFWGPIVVIVYVFGPYLSPRGASQFDFRKSLQVKIPVKKLLMYTLIAFIGISAFTFYFKTESYTLGMRVACLIENKRPTYISFGSMIYGEVKNNEIEVTGAPMFPVKTVAIILGNASKLVTPIPDTMTVEPQELTSLVLQAKIPPRGEVDPGIYTGTVYIFSDTLLLILPESLILSVFHAISNPWATLVLLDIIAASALAFLIALIALSVNWTSSQILYTLVWNDKLERGYPHALRLMMHKLKKRILMLSQKVSELLSKGYAAFRREVELRKALKPSGIAAIPSVILFLLIDNILLPVLILGIVLSFSAWKIHFRKRSELIASAALANMLLAAAFIARRASIVLYSQINMFWCIVSAGFVGNISYIVTVPIALSIVLILFVGFEWTRVWYVEQQTFSWRKIIPSETVIKKTLMIPSLDEYERLSRRRLKIPVPKIPNEVIILLRRVRKHLMRAYEAVICSFRILRLEAHVAYDLLKRFEGRFIDKEKPLLILISNLRKGIGFFKDSIQPLISDVSWLTRMLVYEVFLAINRR